MTIELTEQEKMQILQALDKWLEIHDAAFFNPTTTVTMKEFHAAAIEVIKSAQNKLGE